MKKSLLTTALLFLISGLSYGQTLSAGDIAIIGVSVDDEKVLMVALEDISSGETLFVTDDEWNGSAFNSGEGFYEWVTPAITAGDVFTFTVSGVTGVTGSDQGTVTQKAGSITLSNSGDGIFIYQTSTNVYNTGTYTVIGFAGEDSGDAGTLTGSGLTLGDNAVYFGGDNGIYTGSRTGQNKSGYLGLIYDSGNWTTSGSSQTLDETSFVLTAGAVATKLVVTAVNSDSSPSAGVTFDVTVQAQATDDNPASVSGAVNITLSKATGTGTLGGTLTGTITDGTNSITISGVTFDTAESGVSITATDDATTLTAGTSATFDVLAAADTLVLVSAPTTGTTDVSLSSFTVEARRTSDESKDLNYTKSITISKASGTGTLGGTVTKATTAGVATFDDLTFDTAGDFTIEATDGSLTSDASATITISDPQPSYLIITGVFDGPLSGGTPKGIELFATADIADLSSYGIGSANNGGGTDGEEYTFPAVAVSAGTFIYLTDNGTNFDSFFGFSADYETSVASINGDDAVELFKDGIVSDVFGDINTDGSDESWDFLDGWAYRKNIKTANTTFNDADWTFSGINNLEGGTTNATVTSPFPYKTYTNGWFVHLHGTEGWRLISSPVVGPMEDLLDPIWTQGIASGADVTTGDPNVFGWDNSTLDQDYSAISNLSGSFSAGLGYLVYVYADDNYDGSADAFPKTLSISGTENAVDASPSLIGGNNSYFYLVGNPFASTIDFDAVTKTDLTDVAYVWDPNSETGNEGKNGETASGSWKSWNGTTGDITDGLIAPFQGFFIQSETTGFPSPEITFGAASKSTGGTFLGKANTSTIAKARIKVSGANTANSMWVQFSNEGSATSHVKGDAVELQSLDDSFAELAAIKGGELFDIAHLPIAEEVSLPISFRTTEDGTYTFTASNFEIPSSFSIVFHDYETGKSMTVDENFSYEFEATAIKQKSVPVLKSLQQGPIVAKANTENRFGLVVTQKVASSNEIKELPSVFALDQNYPNPFNPTTTIKYSVAKAGEVHLSVYNMMGQKVTDLVSGTKQAGNYAISWNAEGMASGMYFYRLSSAGQTITRQMTLIK